MVAALNPPLQLAPRIRPSAQNGDMGRITRQEGDALDLRSALRSLQAATEQLAAAVATEVREDGTRAYGYMLDQAMLAADTLLSLGKRYGRSPARRSVAEDIGDELSVAEDIGDELDLDAMQPTRRVRVGSIGPQTEYKLNQERRYRRLRAAGICIRCGKVPAVPGTPLCEAHRDALAQVRNAKASTARKVKL